MHSFIPGLELNRLFFTEIVQPLLTARFPDVAYSAGLIGYGSDVLGYDTEISTDHEWGPRLLLFLRNEDYPKRSEAINKTFRRELPLTFHGFSTNFSAPNTDDKGVRILEAGKPGHINHHITLTTTDAFLRWELGITAEDSIRARDWLTFPEQKLLEVTAGAVYYDGLEQLAPLRQRLNYYPHDVWLYRLAAQWQRISQEEAFVGRCGDVGDEIGSRVVTARLVRDLMRLCFLLERRYAPYSKWLGTAFTRLQCGERLTSQLAAVLAASTWEERQQRLAEAYAIVATMQNALAIAEPQDPTSRLYHGRPYRVIHAERFASALAAAVRDGEVQYIMDTVGLVGAVDQFADSADVLSNIGHSRRLGSFLTDTNR